MLRFWRTALAALLAGPLAALTFLACPAPPIVGLTATALYMGGTGHTLTIPGPDPPSYIDRYVTWAYDRFVGPSELCGPACTQAAIYTPAEFWPDTGWDSLRFDQSVALGLVNLEDCLRARPCAVTDPPFTSSAVRVLGEADFTVFGYSDSATIATIAKSNLIAHPPAGRVSFVLLSSGNRPNGGILERFVGVHLPILGVTFNGATVTNSPQPTPLTTVDIAYQYDLISDFPTNPLNLLADLNALIAFPDLHPEFGGGTPLLQGQYQDSTYYLIPTEILPLVRPLTVVPYLGPLLAAVLDPPLRVLVEAGYDRTINPGAPTPAKWLYLPNPISTTLNFLKAIPTGWDNGIAYATGDPTNRPFGTTPPGPYGVGGPPVDAGAVDPYGPPTPLSTPALRVAANSVARQGVAAAARPRAAVRARTSASRPASARPLTRTAPPRDAGAAATRPARQSVR